jgi:hypothetical protein
MRYCRLYLGFTLALTLLFLQNVSAQESTTQTSDTKATNANGLKVLNLEDYGRWNRITSTAVSQNGSWLTFTYTPNEGEQILHAKAMEGDKEYTASLGPVPPGAGRGGGGRGGRGGGNVPQFSDDSR